MPHNYKEPVSQFQMALGRVIASHRLLMDWDQATLGPKIDRVKTTVSRIEMGTANPRLDCLEAAAEAFGVPLSDLVAQAESLVNRLEAKEE